MRSILVQGGNDPGVDTRVRAALAVARALGGHVTVLFDTPLSRYISTDLQGGGTLAVEALNQALETDDERALAMEAALAGQNVPFTVVRSESESLDALATAGRLADLVVLSRASGLVDRFVTMSRVPILALPDGLELPMPFARACVAWDGGEQAAAALRAATPLLLRACEGVEVLTVREEGALTTPDDAVRYLRLYGIEAEGTSLDRAGSIADTLASAVASRAVNLLVMGAYGHGRVRELLFGGVTRHLLEHEPPLALLLAH